MTLILAAVVALVPRPAYEPVGSAELARVAQIEQQQAQLVASSVPSYVPADIIPGRFVVGFEPGELDRAVEWVREQGGGVIRVSRPGGDFIVARFDVDLEPAVLASAAGASPAIRYAEPDLRVSISYEPNDPLYVPHQWDKWVMYSDRAWDVTRGSNSVTVAVIDNGVDYRHPDLVDRYFSGAVGYDFVAGDADPSPDNPNLPGAFHGTHVSGIIGATIDNGEGVAGWANCRLLAVKALNDSGSGDMADVADAILWAANNGADVVNMSLGSTGVLTALVDACQYAVNSDVLLLAASGNEGSASINYPAALDQCVCVGATDENSGLADFSNHGVQQELVAPGTTVPSTAPNGEYWYSDGTSMATPEVSGVAALVLAANASLPSSRLRALLDASAVDKGAPGRDNLYGYGFVNAGRALELASMDSPRVGGAGRQVVVVRDAMELPSWAEAVRVYDGLGRVVARWQRGDGPTLHLDAGTYFVRAAAAGRLERYRLLVVR